MRLSRIMQIMHTALCLLRNRLGSTERPLASEHPKSVNVTGPAVVFVCDPHNPDDAHTLRCLKNAEEMHYAIVAYDQWLRSQVKYHNREELQAVRETLHDFLHEEGVSIDE